MCRLVHWRYLANELTYRWRRTALLVGGIALAATLVVMLDVLGRSFADVATVPFRSLGANLIVQRNAVQTSVPKQMGIMLPYSAQPITQEEATRLASEPGVSQSAGFVLLWNLGAGRFYSISGIPLDPNAPALGPGRIREWLINGRLPEAGKPEILVERHYGAFYRLDPGRTVEIGGKTFTVVGVIDIKEGSQIASSNFYMDIGEARTLAGLPEGLVNQVFLDVADIADTETVKQRIAGWLPHASVASPGTMLQLFGGVSQTIGRFGPIAVGVGAAAALALGAMLVLGVVSERRRELALLRVLGWSSGQVRRQMAVEMTAQGLLAGLAALVLVAFGLEMLARATITLPASLGGENPVDFAAGGFRAASSVVHLPVGTRVWDWISPPIIAAAACGAWGWLWSGGTTSSSLWAAIKT
ncbi:MAG: ABC transporter permease [Rhodoplanes sp.]|uniref:ABC transporter permease n=1 Tax=Rhodoplanes sp. TaxID=1968906 RepID=UPI001838537C|nr:ABC transporter permease [Rhodoplanes sp.]NVO15921.1 ABC transporter permease [Rhodoplanes sp.]